MNIKLGFRNIFTNIVSQITILLLGIVIPRLVIINLGSEVNGLLSSINQALVYVSLLEAGVGAASLQALYGPVATNDHTAINSILSATHHFYKRTGFLYFLSVVALTVFFPLTLATELKKATIMWVVFLSGMPGVINYYYQGKFRLLLQAEGKSYILTVLTTIVRIFADLGKIILLLCGFDIVALQSMYLLFNIVQVAFIGLYIKRHYKWLNLNTKPNFDAISQSKNALVHQLSGFIFSNTDALILTYFCGLGSVSVYSTYALFFGITATMINNFSGANFILGQTFNSNRQHYLKLHNLFEVYNMALTFSLYCITNIFILPFLSLYTSGVTDMQYVDQLLPYFFLATYLLSNGRTASSHVINYAGHFRQTQSHAIIESIINIFISLISVKHFGIYGVLIGTIAALLYRTNDMILYANKKILHRSPWITYRRWLLNLALFLVITALSKHIFSFIPLNSYLTIIMYAALSCAIIIPIFFVTVSLFERETARYALQLITPYARKLSNKLRKSK